MATSRNVRNFDQASGSTSKDLFGLINWILEFSQISENDILLIFDSESMWDLPVLVEPNYMVLETEQDFYVDLSVLRAPHSSLLHTGVCLCDKESYMLIHPATVSYLWNIFHITCLMEVERGRYFPRKVLSYFLISLSMILRVL